MKSEVEKQYKGYTSRNIISIQKMKKIIFLMILDTGKKAQKIS